MRKLLYTLFALAALVCCSPEPADEHIVVDGWIEDGGFPVVMLTSSLPVWENTWSAEDLRSHVLTLATVTVSDGENSVVLTGMKNDNYFPPYIYTTSHLRGEAGKTYSLEVKYGRTVVSAVTTIPSPQPLLEVRSELQGDGYMVYCRFTRQPGSYYAFFSRREGKDKMYLPSFMTLVDGDATAGGAEYDVSVMRGFDINAPEHHEDYYELGDQVSVRFCTMDRDSYEFWKGYEESWIMSHNPFFPVTSGVHSNITGGYGLWAGYGATYCDAPAAPAE